MRAPVVGLTVDGEHELERRFHTIAHEYVSAIATSGAIPVLLAPLPRGMAAGAVAVLDGLVLAGGGDVAPRCYGAATEAETEGVDEERDESELATIKSAVDAGIPILGICRGAQLLNVAFGGTLHQHLATSGAHLSGHRRAEVVHSVELIDGSLLSRLTGLHHFEVNSIHHQGIDQVSSDLRPVGFAEDGVIEVLESADRSILGVQWHPECLPDSPVTKALFSWLTEEAGLFATRRQEKTRSPNESD